MARDYLKEELEKVYKQLFQEIENFETKVKDVKLYSKNHPKHIVSKTNNTNTIVSVVTPAYNANNFLLKLYQSLKRQSIAKYVEWVIVDDCSKDNSMELYEQLDNDNELGKINVFRNEKNLGAALSLKNGFSLASSNILAWVSADDFYISEDKLQKDIQLINNGFDIVFSKYTLFGTDIKNSKKVSVPSKKYQDKYQMLIDILLNNYINGSSVCMKKDVYLEIGEMNEFLINVDGDLDLWTRIILLDKKIGFSDTVVFNYQHQGQTSRAFERMIVGKNITRLSYIRLLKHTMEHEKIKKILSVVLREKYRQHFLRNFLIFILFQSKLIGRFDTILFKKARNYFLNEFFWYTIWLEELTNKQYRFVKYFINTYPEFFEAYEMFKGKIYKLSDEFMKTETFRTFVKRYEEINNNI